MNDAPFIGEAVAATAAAADALPPRPEYDPARYLPVRAADLAQLLAELAAQRRIITAIADHLGIEHPGR